MAVSVAQRAVYAEPSNLEQRNRLATSIVRDGGNKDGCALLADTGTLSSGSSTLSGDIQALADALHIQSVALASQATLTIAEAEEETSEAFLGRALRKAQRAILLRPWDLKGWQTLAYVRSQCI
jgi:superkiller protein 3